MYEHLLVSLDGSAAAERALEHAEALAAAFGSTVTLLRATLSAELLMAEAAAPDTVGDVAPAIDHTPIIEAERQAAAAYLDAIAARLQTRGVHVRVEVPAGARADVIVERARALGVSLIVMTTHGRGGLRRLVFGSVADHVLRHATCPVLLVRITEDDDSAG